MTKIFPRCALLAGAVALSLMAQAQQAAEPISGDIAMAYSLERAKIVDTDCGCFWLQGGSVDAAITLFHGLGAAVNTTGEHRSNVTPGVDLDKFSFMAGPRYTWTTNRFSAQFLGSNRETSVFGEALFGGAHAFDSVFPTTSGVVTTASSFSMQLGGGLNIGIAKGFGVRALEVDYVRTSLPNNGSNTQHDLRLAFGVNYHLGKYRR
jgi:hypothetical protein